MGFGKLGARAWYCKTCEEVVTVSHNDEMVCPTCRTGQGVRTGLSAYNQVGHIPNALQGDNMYIHWDTDENVMGRMQGQVEKRDRSDSMARHRPTRPVEIR